MDAKTAANKPTTDFHKVQSKELGTLDVPDGVRVSFALIRGIRANLSVPLSPAGGIRRATPAEHEPEKRPISLIAVTEK
jgi:hypothetical protein